MTDFQRYINTLLANEETEKLRSMICSLYRNNYPFCKGCPMHDFKSCKVESEETKDFFYKHTIPYEDIKKTIDMDIDELKETFWSKRENEKF